MLNADIAGRLDEVAQLLAAQGANPFRVRAYQPAKL
jgi:DNA polymerase/3'-5' exonuclease PolX